MKKIKNILNKVVSDELSAFIILGFVTLAIISSIVINWVLQNRYIEVSSTTLKEQKENSVESVENLTSVADVNNIEELQKINEKEVEESKEKEKEKNKDKSNKGNNNSSTPKYYIKVNYGAQVVTVYTKDSNGKYTKPVKAMVCSTGTYTPTGGVYKTPNRFRWLDMIGGVYAQYCTQIVGDILFHSVPYLEKYNNSSLEYWAYDKLGTRCSLGCIRLTCQDAKWIYDNCKLGTQVEFYSSSNPGPLGKPTARKISSAPENIRGWDPTDPVEGNPWGDYLKSLEDKKEGESTNSIKNDVIQDTVEQNTLKNEIVNNIITSPEVNNTIINDIISNEIEMNNSEVNNGGTTDTNTQVNDIVTNTEVNDVNDAIVNTEVNSLI